LGGGLISPFVQFFFFLLELYSPATGPAAIGCSLVQPQRTPIVSQLASRVVVPEVLESLVGIVYSVSLLHSKDSHFIYFYGHPIFRASKYLNYKNNKINIKIIFNIFFIIIIYINNFIIYKINIYIQN
jgi:hypothetical protein